MYHTSKRAIMVRIINVSIIVADGTHWVYTDVIMTKTSAKPGKKVSTKSGKASFQPTRVALGVATLGVLTLLIFALLTGLAVQ